MDIMIKLNSQTAGKDKSARLIQYLCRASWDCYQTKQVNSELVDSLKTLEYLLGSFRKLLRFGKCWEVFYSSLKTIHYDNVTVRVTSTLSKLAQAMYLFSDHIIWLSRTGLFKSIDAPKWTKYSNKYWLLTIVMNLARDVYEIMRIFDSYVRPKNCAPIRSVSELAAVSLQTIACVYQHKDILLDTFKNSCDFFIPFTALGYTNFRPRTIGMLGAASSIAGLITILQPATKLTPA